MHVQKTYALACTYIGHKISLGCSDKLCSPPPIKCWCIVHKKSGISLAILLFSPGNPDRGDEKVWILGVCVDFSGNLSENKDFCPKHMAINSSILQIKKSLEIQHSQGGGWQNYSGMVH